MSDQELQLNIDGPVLIIDDDESYRNQLKTILDKHGITYVLQESGAHALRFIQNQAWNWKPSIIITDIVMDGMGGYQLIRRLQEIYNNKNIPIVVVSKLNAGIDVGEAEIAGAAAYLTKPFKEEGLLRLLSKVSDKEKRRMIIFTQDQSGRTLSR